MDRIRLIFQDEIWVDGQGRVRPISSMEIGHAQNTYRHLLDGDRPLRTIDTILDSLLRGPMPSGDMAQDSLDSEMERLMQARDNARAWLKEQPLLKALQARGWGAPEPEPGRQSEPGQRKLMVLAWVTVPPGADAGMIEFEIHEALRDLPYDVEIPDLQ